MKRLYTKIKRLPCPILFSGKTNSNTSQGFFDNRITNNHDVLENTTILTNGRSLPCSNLFPGNTNCKGLFDNRYTTNHDVQEITTMVDDFLLKACSLETLTEFLVQAWQTQHLQIVEYFHDQSCFPATQVRVSLATESPITMMFRKITLHSKMAKDFLVQAWSLATPTVRAF